MKYLYYKYLNKFKEIVLKTLFKNDTIIKNCKIDKDIGVVVENINWKNHPFIVNVNMQGFDTGILLAQKTKSSIGITTNRERFIKKYCGDGIVVKVMQKDILDFKSDLERFELFSHIPTNDSSNIEDIEYYLLKVGSSNSSQVYRIEGVVSYTKED